MKRRSFLTSLLALCGILKITKAVDQRFICVDSIKRVYRPAPWTAQELARRFD